MIAGFLAVSGGAILIVAPFFQWISASVGRMSPGGFRRPGFGAGFGAGMNGPSTGVLPGPRGLSVNGIALIPGKVALIGGIVLVAVGLVVWLTTGFELRKVMGIVGLIAGTAAASVVLYRMAVVADGATLSRIQAMASRSVGPGMVLALLGALAGVAAGVVAILAGPPATGAMPSSGESGVTAQPPPWAPTAPEAEAARPVPPVSGLAPGETPAQEAPTEKLVTGAPPEAPNPSSTG
jgi:hypothetical protein